MIDILYFFFCCIGMFYILDLLVDKIIIFLNKRKGGDDNVNNS